MSPRGKTVLARIDDEGKRKKTLTKRKAGLLKKVSKLATLCDAEAAVVVYSPGDSQPTVWPSTSEARATISKFLSRPETERMANSHTARSFAEQICQKKNKAQRLIKMNEERNIQIFIDSIENGKTMIQDLDSERMTQRRDLIDKKKEALIKHINKLKGKEQQTSHLPQVFPLALQEQPEGQAASGLNKDALTAGRNTPSPAAAHGELDASDITPLAPVPFSLPMHNPLTMSPNNSAANRLIRTRRLYQQTNLGGIMQQAPRVPQVLHPALQMPTVSPVTRGPNMNGFVSRGLNMNGFSGSRNFPSSAAAAHGQHVNLTGTTQGVPSSISLSSPTANPPVMSPNNVAAISLKIARGFNGQTNLGGMRQHPLPSPLLMSPSLSTVLMVFSAGGVQDVTDYSSIQHGPPPNTPLEIPRRFGLPPMIPTQYEASGSNMIKDDHRWNATGFKTNKPLEMPRRLGLPPMHPTQYEASGSNMIRDERGWNATGFKTNTPLEMPRRLGLPPMHPTQHEASGSNMIRDDRRWDETGFKTNTPLEMPRRLGLPPILPTQFESSGSNMIGDDHRCKATEFQAPATATLDQRDSDDGTGIGILIDGGVAHAVNNAPPFEVKW